MNEKSMVERKSFWDDKTNGNKKKRIEIEQKFCVIYL